LFKVTIGYETYDTYQVKRSNHCNISYTNGYGFNWFKECRYSCLWTDKLFTLECVFVATPDYATTHKVKEAVAAV